MKANSKHYRIKLSFTEDELAIIQLAALHRACSVWEFILGAALAHCKPTKATHIQAPKTKSAQSRPKRSPASGGRKAGSSASRRD